MTVIWALTDDIAGHNSQTIGVASAFGKPFEKKTVAYSSFIKIPNFIAAASGIGLDNKTKEDFRKSSSAPDIIISAGRKGAAASCFLKRIYPKAEVIHLMNPGFWGSRMFDMVAIPQHDGMKNPPKNFFMTVGAPHKVTEELLKSEGQKWLPRLKDLPRPFTYLIVGGSAKKTVFTKEMATDLARKTREFQMKKGGSVLVTTSRRTGDEQEAILYNSIGQPRYFYKWSDGGDNPYIGFMALADNIIVTGDSISMPCEACAGNAPVFIYSPQGIATTKHERLHGQLYGMGLAAPLDENCTAFVKAKTKLNAAKDVADEFMKRHKAKEEKNKKK